MDFSVDFSACFPKENGPKKSTKKSTAETKHQNPPTISRKGCPWWITIALANCCRGSDLLLVVFFQSGVKGHRFRNCRNFRQSCRQFPQFLGNFRKFPAISGNFRQFPAISAISAISGNFRQFPAISAISGNFRKFWQFPALKFCRRFPDFRNFPAISGNFAGFPENPRLAVVSVQQNPCFALILAQHERFQRFKVVLLPH